MFHPAISEESIINRLNKGVCSLVVFGINLSNILNFPLSEETVEKIIWGWLDLFAGTFFFFYFLNNKKYHACNILHPAIGPETKICLLVFI